MGDDGEGELPPLDGDEFGLGSDHRAQGRRGQVARSPTRSPRLSRRAPGFPPPPRPPPSPSTPPGRAFQRRARRRCRGRVRCSRSPPPRRRRSHADGWVSHDGLLARRVYSPRRIRESISRVVRLRWFGLAVRPSSTRREGRSSAIAAGIEDWGKRLRDAILRRMSRPRRRGPRVSFTWRDTHRMRIHTAEFLQSAGRADQFPVGGRPEVAFAGRSNVGKSSLINRLLGRRAWRGSAPRRGERARSTSTR